MFLAIEKNLKIILIILIIATAAVLRLYRLGDYPVSIYWDEAAIGYNAYSIAQTGADEYGRKWPLAFESFNDFKLPGYIYLDSLFVKILGLSEFAVRLPSAIAGILSVTFIYLLAKKLFGKETIAQLSALLLAISPWSLQLSRAAFETNIALALTIAGIYFLFVAVSKKIFAMIAAPVLALSFYFYYSSYIFAPLILVAFLAINRDQIAQNIKYYLAGIAIALFVVTPAISQLLTPEGSKRVREVSIFADRSLYEHYIQAQGKSENLLSKLYLDRRIPIAVEALDNYLSHFSPGFLFFGQDPNARHHPLQMGGFFIWQIPLLVTGLWFLIKLKETKIKYFLLSCLAISPIPAAFTIEVPHSLRAYNLLIPITLIAALGIMHSLKSSTLKIVTTIVAAVFLIQYLYNYYVIYPIKHDAAWAYGYKTLYLKLQDLGKDYDTIIVTGYYWKPYIYYLFYNQIDPTLYQSKPTQTEIGKYKFGVAGWDTGGQDLTEDLIDNRKSGKTLVILSPQELAGVEVLNRFSPIDQIQNYAQTKTVFHIGQWN